MMQQLSTLDYEKFTEFDLVQQISDNIVNSKLIDKKNSFKNSTILHEVDLGYGRADIVLSNFKIDNKRKNFFDLRSLKVLDFIEKKNTTNFNEVQNVTKLAKRDLYRRLELIEEDEYIKIDDDDISINKKYKNYINNTIAIEAKLTNWRRALKQAYRYQAFANYSYVCLPKKYSRSAVSNLNQFEDLNVGLLESDENGLNVVSKPKRDKPFEYVMSSLLYEKLLAGTELTYYLP